MTPEESLAKAKAALKKKFTTPKGLFELLIGGATYAVTKHVIDENINPEELNAYGRFMTRVGSFSIALFVSEKVTNDFMTLFDEDKKEENLSESDIIDAELIEESDTPQ